MDPVSWLALGGVVATAIYTKVISQANKRTASEAAIANTLARTANQKAEEANVIASGAAEHAKRSADAAEASADTAAKALAHEVARAEQDRPRLLLRVHPETYGASFHATNTGTRSVTSRFFELQDTAGRWHRLRDPKKPVVLRANGPESQVYQLSARIGRVSFGLPNGFEPSGKWAVVDDTDWRHESSSSGKGGPSQYFSDLLKA